ncbi:hypothetical protein [Micromonospora zhanjiangensis]
MNASVPRRPSAAGLALATAVAGVAVAVSASAASAAATTLYASPTGTGTACSAAAPCSLSAAQSAVRSMVGGMSDDIEVQLADGVYRVTSPLTFGAADSGTGGHTVRWRAAPARTRPSAGRSR